MKAFETNVCGVSDVTQAFLPLLRLRGRQNTKKIINLSSVLGSISAVNGKAGQGAAYSVSKAALNMFTTMTALHLAHENFIVYVSHPGWVKPDHGGDDASVELEDSISGMLSKLNTAKEQDNGGYFDFRGKELNW